MKKPIYYLLAVLMAITFIDSYAYAQNIQRFKLPKQKLEKIKGENHSGNKSIKHKRLKKSNREKQFKMSPSVAGATVSPNKQQLRYFSRTGARIEETGTKKTTRQKVNYDTRRSKEQTREAGKTKPVTEEGEISGINARHSNTKNIGYFSKKRQLGQELSGRTRKPSKVKFDKPGLKTGNPGNYRMKNVNVLGR